MGDKKIIDDSKDPNIKYWYIHGLFFGLMMFLVMELLLPYYRDGINKEGLLKAGMMWAVSGLIYGYISRFILIKKQQKEEKKKNQEK